MTMMEMGHNDTLDKKKPRDIFFFPHVRTASHVLCRMLSNQPGWAHSDYHFKRALDFARDNFGWGLLEEVPDDIRSRFFELIQEGYEEIEADRKSALGQGRALFLKEHTFYIWDPYKLTQSIWGVPQKSSFTVGNKGSHRKSESSKTNPTIFPDAYLKAWSPVFLIRHPALAFESWYRAESSARTIDLSDRSWAFFTSFQYSRQLHDWFLENASHDEPTAIPAVVEADDMLENPLTIVKLCDFLGMDPKYILNKWDTIKAPEGAGRRELSFMTTYWSSTTIDKSKTSHGLDLCSKRQLWKDEFGAKTANELWQLVEAAMPDYLYLKNRKI